MISNKRIFLAFFVTVGILVLVVFLGLKAIKKANSNSSTTTNPSPNENSEKNSEMYKEEQKRNKQLVEELNNKKNENRELLKRLKEAQSQSDTHNLQMSLEKKKDQIQKLTNELQEKEQEIYELKENYKDLEIELQNCKQIIFHSNQPQNFLEVSENENTNDLQSIIKQLQIQLKKEKNKYEELRSNLEIENKSQNRDLFFKSDLVTTRVFAIANFLRYSSSDSIKNLSDNIKYNFIDIFKSFNYYNNIDKNSLKHQVNQIVNRFTNHMFVGEQESGIRYQFACIMNYLAKNLINVADKGFYDDYKRNLFICENFSIKKTSNLDLVDKKFELKPLLTFDINKFVSSIDELKETINLDFNFIEYAKYLYLTSTEKGKNSYFLNLNKKHKLNLDKNKFIYTLKGFITKENNKFYSYLFEDNKWRKFINNLEVFDFSLTQCVPDIFLFEKEN